MEECLTETHSEITPPTNTYLHIAIKLLKHMNSLFKVRACEKNKFSLEPNFESVRSFTWQETSMWIMHILKAAKPVFSQHHGYRR